MYAMTGKLNADTDIGFLSMQTAPLRDDDDNRLRASENFTTLRLRRKFFNQQSFVGLMATNRWVEQKINTGVGLDMLINPSGDHYFVGAMDTTFESIYQMADTGFGCLSWCYSTQLGIHRNEVHTAAEYFQRDGDDHGSDVQLRVFGFTTDF